MFNGWKEINYDLSSPFLKKIEIFDFEFWANLN